MNRAGKLSISGIETHDITTGDDVCYFLFQLPHTGNVLGCEGK